MCDNTLGVYFLPSTNKDANMNCFSIAFLMVAFISYIIASELSEDDEELFGRFGRAPLDRSAMVRFGKRAPLDRSAMVRFGKRAPLDRSAMVRFGRSPLDRSAMVRFGKRAPLDRSAMVRKKTLEIILFIDLVNEIPMILILFLPKHQKTNIYIKSRVIAALKNSSIFFYLSFIPHNKISWSRR
uniref:Uncharacterized protein n=1 Tax=Panagrolaimus sp. ES5 TaxID=591445 RepID=A0AC34GY04_9BILA